MNRRREPSLLREFAEATAADLAESLFVPAEARQVYQKFALSVIQNRFGVLVGERVYIGGESKRRIVRETPEQIAERRCRILAALAAGETVDAIARRESVTARWVRRLRQQQRMNSG